MPFTRIYLQDKLLRIWEKRQPTIIFITHDLDEAITFGQRVVLTASSPGCIQKVLDVPLPLPYPRERTQNDFAIFRRELYEEFHLIHQQAASAEYFI